MASSIKRSNTFRIDDLEGDSTDDMFTDFNADGKFTKNIKMKTAVGKVKLNTVKPFKSLTP